MVMSMFLTCLFRLAIGLLCIFLNSSAKSNERDNIDSVVNVIFRHVAVKK